MRSMTGFGRAEGQFGNSHFIVEVKSVNHRFLDARFRLPYALGIYESAFLEKVRSVFDRGAFEVTVKQKLQPSGTVVATGTRFVVDESAAQTLYEACEWLKKSYNLKSGPTLETFVLTNRIFVPIEESIEPEGILEAVNSLLERALKELKKMREAEGAGLRVILQDAVASLSKLVGEISLLAPEQPKKIESRVKSRIAQWGLSQPVDPQRLEMEVAFYAERSDFTEELDRLRAHVEAFSGALKADTSIGRKLDFLTQELHREVNTLGAKASLIEITRLTVDAKAQVEKLREQVQNVE